MSQNGLDVFDRKKSQANQFREAWEAVEQEIDGRLLPLYKSQPDNEVLRGAAERFQAERLDLIERLRVALERLLDRLDYPVLTFATTGTTNSGKSALVNLLCGAEIMPTSNKEMSAGVVTITHGPNRILTVFPPLSGPVPWQDDCGAYSGQTDIQIRERLTRIMNNYNDHRELLRQGRVKPGEMPPCPISELEYPTLIGNRPELLGLPSRCRFRIIDLPGLKDIKDEGNRQIIRERAREAICLVTYNSEEASESLQESLLKEVVAQVRDLGGSPARMLFILNRIDATWRNSTRELAKPTEDEFVAKIEGRIKELLEKNLEGYAEVIQDIEVVRLCTMPALLGNILRFANEPQRRGERIYAGERLSEPWRQFVSKPVWKSVQNKEPEEWTEEDYQRIGVDATRNSYGDAFFACLRGHIDKHFPDLVIPQEVDRFKVDAASRIVEWVVQTVEAELNNSDQRYNEELGRIRRIRGELSELCQSSQQQLTEPFEAINQLLATSQSPPIPEIERILDSLKERPLFGDLLDPESGKPLPESGRLRPLITWRRGIARALQESFDIIGDVLRGRGEGSDEARKRLQLDLTHILREYVKLVQEGGYTTEMAEKGAQVETKDTTEKSKLRKIEEGLGKLATALNQAMGTVMSGAAQVERVGIFDATKCMLDAYWRLLTRRARLIAMELTQNQSDLGFAEDSLPVEMVSHQPSMVYQFTTTFKLENFKQREVVGTDTKTTDEEERRWYTLWLYPHTVKIEKQVDVYGDVEYTKTTVPSVVQLINYWTGQAKEKDTVLVREMVNWLIAQINESSDALRRSQKKMLDRYEARLKQARDAAEQLHALEQVEWGSVRDQAAGLEACLARLSVPPSREGQMAESSSRGT
jgi:hypothetical protein